ncbi:MAG: YihY/virulence factor BrkB family protein [Synechococcaceae cyanobacterium]|nr:YihY/virulence factor BrkB family protein [Synechococcaceae cyanobacterium]
MAPLSRRPTDRRFQWRKTLLRPAWSAYILWLRADCVDLSAAFAYHSLQSFFPALLIVLSLLSRLLGRDQDLLVRIQEQMAQLLPASSMPFFVQTLERFTRQGFGAGILGVLLLVWSANNIYLTLQRGADRLWWNRPWGLEALPFAQLVGRFLLLRLKAFLMILMVAALILVDQFLRALRFFGSSALHGWLQTNLPDQWISLGSLSTGIDHLLSFLISFLATVIFLWLLPSRRVPLRPLLPGALLVSASIAVLNLLLGRALVALGLRFQAYGVVGGVLVLTLWVWLIGVITYFGLCLSVVLARRSPGWRSALRNL